MCSRVRIANGCWTLIAPVMDSASMAGGRSNAIGLMLLLLRRRRRRLLLLLLLLVGAASTSKRSLHELGG
tara:strand:- start:95 stop:304 length:210 start_codon:yes stop_codon:yes gene_type:complete